MAEKAEAWLKAAGAIRTWKKLPGKGTSGGQHQAGTCRMGSDPRDVGRGQVLPRPRHDNCT